MPVFEAAARHNSFKKAAEDLSVTPSAISQQIKALEEYVEVDLFDRTERQFKLTNAGKLYYEIAKNIVNCHTKGYEEFEQNVRRPIFRVSAPLFIAQELLIPNYESFRELEEEIDLRLITGVDYVDFDTEAFDAAIRFGEGYWPDLNVRLLCDIEVCLVCNHTYLTKNNLKQEELLNIEELNHHLLLSTSGDLNDWKRIDRCINSKDRVVFDSYASILKSAQQGLGIAYGFLPVIQPLLDNQSLIRLNTGIINSNVAYWLVAPKNSTKAQNLNQFFQWAKSLFANYF